VILKDQWSPLVTAVLQTLHTQFLSFFSRDVLNTSECYGGVERWETIRGPSRNGASKKSLPPPRPTDSNYKREGGGKVERPSSPRGKQGLGHPYNRPLGVAFCNSKKKSQ